MFVSNWRLPLAASNSKTYIARICWNPNGWRFPAGEARYLEKGSYVVEAGFGHEEWLFNFAWLIDGYHYTFLQPVSRSFEKFKGQVINVLLYTISPTKSREYVGEIVNCEVLSRSQAEAARSEYEQRDWLASMVEQVREVGGKAEYIATGNSTSLFNVRFRPQDARIYDPRIVASDSDSVQRSQRYTLAIADENVEREWRSREGKITPPSIRTITRKGVPTVSYDPLHQRLQADLLHQLEIQYGKGNVTCEADFVDITVRDGQRTILIEIKTCPHARGAIREAIGQLLEYGYYRRALGDSLDLVVVAPGLLDQQAQQYIQRLRTEFKIPISYISHSEGQPLKNMFS
jgi:hypothetical protein